MVWGEAAADIGGMAIGLKIAEKYQDFDYDLYFRSHAALWRMQSTINTERYDVFNEHPLRYLRINTVVQQFDEFLDTYGIQEGDLMYLKPEDRILSVRELGSELGVNPNTVARSYEKLTDAGIIYTKRGLGYFVAPGAKEIVLEAQRKDFMENEWPRLLKRAALLDINLKELL
jgi:DNA-binding transcriptional regulator YhcF (GntR family)